MTNAKANTKRKSLNITSSSRPQEFVLCTVDYILRRILTVKAPVKIGFYFLIVTLISVLGDLARPGPSYFSDKRNIFNQYFVKLGWGWTLANVCAFVILANLVLHKGDMRYLSKPFGRIAILTLYWYVCTHSMEWIENYTGSCSYSKFTSKRPCLKEGYNWLGFDISGHCFLLVHSLLFINEEAQIIYKVSKQLDQMEKLRSHSGSENVDNQIYAVTNYKLLLRVITPILVFFMCLWEFMLVITALYFHTSVQKILGMFIALGGWFLVYKVLRLSPLST